MITPHLPIAFLLTNPDGSPMSAMELFHAGHEIMWPIAALWFIALTVIVERLIFTFRENAVSYTHLDVYKRQPRH